MTDNLKVTRLKTLEDINLFNDDLKDNIAKDKVKAEAVKWMKDINHSSITVESWIKHFFNITEEDLK